jgi:FMN phosphatase YigB (HAD superfamily)
MKTTPIETVLIDFDNTIANWVKYAAKAYPAMAEALARVSGIEKTIIIEEMIKVYAKHQTVEHTPLVQEMEIFRDHPNLKNLIIAAKNAFTAERNNHLALYEGILPLLEELRHRVKKIVILTDAPHIQATLRSRKLKIDHLIDDLIGLKSPALEQIHEPFRNQYQDIKFNTHVSEQEKPHTKLQDLLSIIHKRPLSLDEISSTTIMLGDNLSKDIQLAVNFQMDAYHCLYGHPDSQDYEEFRAFSPSQRSSRNVSIPNTQPATLAPSHPLQRIISIYHPTEILEDLRKTDFSIQR